MRVFKTNAAQGYGQSAWIIPIAKSGSGYDYLCIDSNNDRVVPGEVLDELEDFYLEEELNEAQGNLILTRSPLSGFLLSHFLKTYSDPT